MNSSLAERLFIVLSAGIHFGEFFLGREVSCHALGRDSLVNSSLAERFFNILSAGILFGELFLSREVS